MNLNSRMELEHVIRVHENGTVTDADGIYAPEIYIDSDEDGQISREHEKDMIGYVQRQGWSLLTGWTGQYMAGGSPIMHPSEFIGGGLESHILENPGYYVACVASVLDSEDDAGWVVAFQEAPDVEGVPLDEIPHADYPHHPGRLPDCARCESECFCTGRPGDTECVFCAVLNDQS